MSSASPKQIFVSHAYDDRTLVDEFVDQLLINGLGLNETDIFYSSGAGTGVPGGRDLLAHVRERLVENGLVIAIVSPTFQTRPVCLAELGAAWSRGSALLPFTVPGMDRDELEGVLGNVAIHGLDKASKLDEIRDRVEDLDLGKRLHSVERWNKAKEKWVGVVENLAAALPRPTIVSAEAYADLEAKLEGSRIALREAQDSEQGLQRRIDAYLKAEGSAEKVEALLPEDEYERFEFCLAEASGKVGKLKPSVVREAVFYTISAGGMAKPDWGTDGERFDEVTRAVDDKLLEENDGWVTPNEAIVDNEEALEAARALNVCLQESSEEFAAWFRKEYRASPDLTIRQVWDALI